MKIMLVACITAVLISCGNQSNEIAALKARVDSLQQSSYKPGFGEFMSAIQVHHAKLWFAGENKNWRLADFEIHEIGETLEALTKFQSERKESQLVTLLIPALDSVAAAVRGEDPGRFRSHFITLTKTCNECHKATQFEFNIVKIPDTPPFSNQAFK